MLRTLAGLVVALNAYAATLAPTPPAEIYVRQLIETYASDLATSTRHQMVEVVRGESGFNPLAHNLKENSRGLVQIHQASWPNITDAQAFDPVFSVNFMADAFRKGNQRWWTCWKNIYEKHWKTCHESN